MTSTTDLSRRSFLRQTGHVSLTGMVAPWLANLATIGATVSTVTVTINRPHLQSQIT